MFFCFSFLFLIIDNPGHNILESRGDSKKNIFLARGHCMKKSRRILLTIMGTLLASSCGREPDIMRNIYNNRDDCVQDYSNSQCREEQHNYSSSGTATGRWIGPNYRSGSPDYPGPGRENLAAERQVVKRGGFGLTGQNFLRGS